MTSTAKTDINYTKTNIKTGRGGIVASLTTALDDLRDNVRDGLVGVSSDATHNGTLEDVLLAGTSISMSTQNGGGNETRTIALDSADGIDIAATAGEALSERDMVYLDESDGEWYQQDSDATSSVKMGRLRGCVTESGGIAEGETGTVRILGAVSGFTSLTAGENIYASTTAGGYTQTKPFASASGAQICVSEMGYATSTTTVWIEPAPVTYRKRGDVANGGTLTIEHHVDSEGYERDVDIRLIDITLGSTLTEHDETNHEGHYPLQGPDGNGSTSTSAPSLTGVNIIGTNGGGTEYICAQAIGGGSGIIYKFDVELGANGGSPTGTITWEIQTNDGGDPSGVVVNTGEFTPVPSSTNTVIVPDGPQSSGGDHWLVLKSTDTQAAGSYFGWEYGVAGSFGKESDDDGSTWSDAGGHICQIYRVDSNTSSRLGQSFEISSPSTVETIRLYLAKFGTPTGDLTASIYSNSGFSPASVISNGTSISVDAESIGTDFGWVNFTFETPPSLSASTTYWIVLETTDSQSDDNFVSWALEIDSPSYADGNAKQYDGSWAVSQGGDHIFDILDESEIFHTQTLIDDWGSALATFLVRFDDGSGSNPTINTTVKNNTGGEETLELAVTFN